MTGAPASLVDTGFITIRVPGSAGLSFPILELVVLVCGVLTLRHALHERRRGDGVPLLVWGASFTYGIVMEVISYNFFHTFHHGPFTVMFYRAQLPLYIVTVYPVLQYPGIIIARRLRLGPVAEAFVAGLLIVATDAPYDTVGPPSGWWVWSSTDPNTAVRWLGVPVTSYYWHLAFGGILAGLCRAFGRWGGEPERPGRVALLVLPIAALTIVLGMVSFVPFHILKARGIGDGTLLIGLFTIALAVGGKALMGRHVARAPLRDPALLAIPALFFAVQLGVGIALLYRQVAA
jgi:hypothetical protein